MVPAVSDTAVTEQGIDAIPETDAVFIEWNLADDELVRQYFIYRAVESAETFTKIAVLPYDCTCYEDSDVGLYTRYFYYVTAVSADGFESGPSDTVNYRLVKKATGLSLVPESDPARPGFTWLDPNDPTEGGYILRLVDAASGDHLWLTAIQSSYGHGIETVIYNADGNAVYDSLLSGREYQWRVDITPSTSFSGSESQWATFTIQ
ncbi:hypothetical protein JXO52_13675 [bacterium]|nr:hypothetical protein [bacterium]